MHTHTHTHIHTSTQSIKSKERNSTKSKRKGIFICMLCTATFRITVLYLFFFCVIFFQISCVPYSDQFTLFDDPHESFVYHVLMCVFIKSGAWFDWFKQRTAAWQLLWFWIPFYHHRQCFGLIRCSSLTFMFQNVLHALKYWFQYLRAFFLCIKRRKKNNIQSRLKQL